MKQRWQAVAAAVAVVSSGWAGTARALDLPPDLRTASNVTTNQGTIDKYVQTHLDAAVDPAKSAEDHRKTLEELYRQVSNVNPSPPSTAFVNGYLRAASAGLTPLLSDKSVNKQLTAAIALANLAGAAPTNPDLIAAVEKAAASGEQSVALWGVKAAGNMLPGQMRFIALQGANKAPLRLIAAIVAGAKGNINVGPIVQDAYNALALPDAGQNQAPVPKEAYLACVQATNEILAARTATYANGVPQYPQAERAATSFLSREPVRTAMNKAAQQQTVRECLNLMVAAANQVPNAGAQKRDVELNVSAAAGLASFILDAIGPNAARGPLRQVSDAKPGQPNVNLPALVDAAVAAVQKMPGFADVGQPPAAQPVGQAAAPNP